MYPVNISTDWNLFSRTIIPVISQPPFVQNQDSAGGLGDIQFSTFLSPVKLAAGGWIWGAGAIAQFGTAV